MCIKIMHVFHRVESVHITKVMELPCTSRLCVFVLCKMRVPYFKKKKEFKEMARNTCKIHAI